MKLKTRGFLSITLAILIVGVMLAGSSIIGLHVIHNVKKDQIRMMCDEIDRSLEIWSKSHRAVQEETVRYHEDGHIYYAQKRVYPETLQELEELKKIGYLARSLEFQAFRYSTRAHGTEYHLEADLPGGGKYVSRRSTY